MLESRVGVLHGGIRMIVGLGRCVVHRWRRVLVVFAFLFSVFSAVSLLVSMSQFGLSVVGLCIFLNPMILVVVAVFACRYVPVFSTRLL